MQQKQSPGSGTELKPVWARLKKGNCPKCDAPLKQRTIADVMACDTPTCDFKIARRKFNDITASMQLDEQERERDNFQFDERER